MIYRQFGKTGLQMSVLTFGAMRSMQTWNNRELIHIPEQSQLNLEAILEKAFSHGINHIETAHGYGSSEQQLGLALSKHKRKDYLLQTKVSPYEDPEQFRHRFLDSLRLLKTEYVDMLAIHGINNFKSLWHSCRKGGCLEMARKLQKEGRVNHIGFSGHGPCDVIMEAIYHTENGGFDFVNLHWYYIFDVNRPAIDLATDKNLGVYIISPTDKGGMLQNPPKLLIELCSPLSPILFNDLYCLDKQGVTSIGVGASKISDFEEHLKCLPLLIDDNKKALLKTINDKLEKRMKTQTGYSRPDALWDLFPAWQENPGNINCAMTAWLFMLAKGWNLHDYARQRYEKLSTGSQWVPGNNCSKVTEYAVKFLTDKTTLSEQEITKLFSEAHLLLS